MTWTATALSTGNLDSTSDNLASGLNEIKLAVDRVNELSAHPTVAHRTAMALTAQSVVQFATTSTSSWTVIAGTTSSNIIPVDNTKPQVTEGYGVLSLSFTPKSATSTIVVSVKGYALCGGTAIYDSAVAALFSSASSDAIQATWLANAHTAGVSLLGNLAMEVTQTSGSTTARTYSLRVGPNTSTGTVILNGNSSTQIFNNASSVVLTITEFV